MCRPQAEAYPSTSLKAALRITKKYIDPEAEIARLP
jgi:hypothetical protein